MINKKLLTITGLLLLASGSFTYADDYRDVVRSSDGQIVHSEFSGACVRTKWMTNTDACDAHAPVMHTVIAIEDRTVYFDFDQAVLTPEAMAILDSLAERMKSASDVQGARVVGYADRIGTASYNEKLSKHRAQVVRDYLVAHGVTNSNVTKVHWVGKSEPKAECQAGMQRPEMISCLQPDRRVEVQIVYHAETAEVTPAKPHHHKKTAKK